MFHRIGNKTVINLARIDKISLKEKQIFFETVETMYAQFFSSEEEAAAYFEILSKKLTILKTS